MLEDADADGSGDEGWSPLVEDEEGSQKDNDEVDTKVQVVTTIRLTHQDSIENKVQDYSVLKEVNIGSKSISKLGKRYISLVIEFFQSNNTFSSSDTPLLSNSIDKLFVEFSNVGIEDISKLWSNIGTNYVPSVSYKIKHIVFDGNAISENVSSVI